MLDNNRPVVACEDGSLTVRGPFSASVFAKCESPATARLVAACLNARTEALDVLVNAYGNWSDVQRAREILRSAVNGEDEPLPQVAGTARVALEVLSVSVAWEQDPFPYEEEGEFLGCIARAEIRNPATNRVHVIASALWGIDSGDDDQEYLLEIEMEQLRELSDELAAFGIDASADELGRMARFPNDDMEPPDVDESDALCPCGDVDCSRPWGHDPA